MRDRDDVEASRDDMGPLRADIIFDSLTPHTPHCQANYGRLTDARPAVLRPPPGQTWRCCGRSLANECPRAS